MVSKAGPVHSLPPLLLSEVFVLVLVRVPVPSHVAEQVPSIQLAQMQSTVSEEEKEMLWSKSIQEAKVARRGGNNSNSFDLDKACWLHCTGSSLKQVLYTHFPHCCYQKFWFWS